MLKTDPICILTSGHTIDGREVSAKVVQELADTYNPDTYNAIINEEHRQYGTKLGTVISLEARDFGEQKKLFAVLKPNDFFLYLNQQGQKLHTSVEIVLNFAKTGKAYLTGLALTDSPASLGTTELKLSVNGEQAEVFTSAETIENTKPTFSLKNPFQKKENIMDKATLEAIAQMQTQLSEVSEEVKALTVLLNKKPEESEEAQAPEELTALKSQISELSKTVADQTTLLTKLKAETDKQDRAEATGTTDTLEDVL